MLMSLRCPTGQGVFCVPSGAHEDQMRFTQDSGVCFVCERAVGLYYVRKSSGVSIVCLTGQGYLLCASQDRGVFSVPPGTQGM